MNKAKKILSVLALVVIMPMSAWGQDAKPDLSGTWNIDLAKSDFGPTPAPDSMVQVIVHKEPALKVSTTIKSAAGVISNERNLTTDGKENSYTLKSPAGEQPVKSTSTWSGNKLLTTLTLETQGVTIDMTDSWELSADGKVLTINREIKTPQGDFTVKGVYNKQ